MAGCLFALPQIPLGLVLGLLALELVLRLNPTFLLKGIAPPAAMDAPVLTLDYDVRYSDGDAYGVTGPLIKPLAPGGNAIEAHVHYLTDEFGFPNAAPLPPNVDVVVEGRSYSMGAQAANPWPRQYAAQTGRAVLNLSQQGSGIDTKIDFFNQYGLPRRPHWLIIEVLPPQDILFYNRPDSLLLERVAFPLIQTLTTPIIHYSGAPIYPIKAIVNGNMMPLVFYPADLQALTADGTLIGKSKYWQIYSSKLLTLANEAAAHNVCTAILYAPTKPEIYVPLIQDPDALAPVAKGLAVWEIDANNQIYPGSDRHPDVKMMQSTTNTAHTLVAQFASDHHLLFIDPTDAFSQSAMNGQAPYLTYDTHWSAVGQDIVARTVEAALPPAKIDSAVCN